MIAALVAGFVTVLLMQPAIVEALHMPEFLKRLSFPYQLCIGTLVSTIICGLPRGVGECSTNMVEALPAGIASRA